MWKAVVGGIWRRRSSSSSGVVKNEEKTTTIKMMIMMGGVRYISRNREPRNLRKIDPKVPYEEATELAQSLYNTIKLHGPLTVSNTWNLVSTTTSQEAGMGGLKSKTHMKLMLKWMRGRNMLKLFCNQVGSSKKFLHCTLPEDPQTEQSRKLMELKLHSVSPKRKNKKQQQQQIQSLVSS